jgi:hypothetical protein
VDEMSRECSINRGDMKCIQNFNKKPEGNTQHGRHMHRWKDDDKTNHKETRYEGMDWIKLAQNRGQWLILVNNVMNLQVP